MFKSMKSHVIGHFLFVEKTTNGLDELENVHHLHFKPDGAPPLFIALVAVALNETFGDRWLGQEGPTESPRASAVDLPSIRWRKKSTQAPPSLPPELYTLSPRPADLTTPPSEASKHHHDND
ncbi:hypothetical protein J6590_073103 [Homalodisca vitripennis]|nr:hypothetical protein J6590_073103 [Homalodisca vitripennis]